MTTWLDVKSVFKKHIICRSVDDEHVELWCGRIAQRAGQTPKPQPGPTCDSCITAARFTCDLDGRTRR